MLNWSQYEPDLATLNDAKRTSASRVRLVILNALAAGELAAGTRVIETELGAALHVSRTPLREALTALRAEGILEHDGDGVRVRQMAWRDIADLYEMRGTLEGMAARLAARQASQSEKAIITQLSEEELALIANEASADKLAQHNKRFHQAILQSANNPFLAEAITKLSRLTILLGSTVYHLADRRHLITEEHHDIQKAICAGDGAKAEETMRHHLANGLAARLQIISQTKEHELD